MTDIKKQRLLVGYTIKTMAKALKVSEAEYTEIEDGKKPMTDFQAEEMALICGLPKGYFKIDINVREFLEKINKSGEAMSNSSRKRSR